MDKIITRKILSLLLILVFSLSYAQSIYTQKYIKVVYNENWTKDSLQVVENRLKNDYNISVKFKDVEMDSTNNYVKSFRLNVNCNDGYAGSAFFGKRIQGTQFGFIRNYKKFALTQFIIGYLKDE